MTVRRIHVLGASGCGTSTLGRALAEAGPWAHFDTDAYYWIATDPPFTTKRDVDARRALLAADLDAASAFVLTGSLCGWGDVFVPRFDLVVFLTLSADERMRRLRARETERYGAGALRPGGRMHDIHTAFLAWAQAYDTAGTEQRSRVTHEAWLARLMCPVLRLESSAPVSELVARVRDIAG